MKNKKINLKELCLTNITQFNYDAATDELVDMIYRYAGVNIREVSGEDVIRGTKDVPKYKTVMRSVQLRKKEVKAVISGWA